MSHAHHADPIEENIDTHPARLAIGIVIGAAALIVGIILITQLAVGMYGSRSRKDDPAMSDAAVNKRLAPVAQVAVEESAAPAANAPAAAAPATNVAAAAPAAAAPAPAAKAAAPAASANGKKTYDGVCVACHAAGVAGAPKFGDKAAWAPRLKAGKDSLYNSALKGKGAMPAKGGNAGLPDADVKAAVDYMVSAAQ
ncbi:MAG TPA: c-type cytochrome [Usitatibacter sp.]|nr:c-type cytochrome [Usitatibacter sp.]